MLGETVRGEHGPVAVRTRLGWVLSGPVSPRSPGSSTNLVTYVLNVGTVTQSDVNKGLQQQLRAFWELESIGICHDESSVSQRFEGSINFKNGRYEVTLPWKDPEQSLLDNYQISHKRLMGLIRRLRQDPDTLRMYDEVI